MNKLAEYAGDSINNIFKRNDADCGRLIYFVPFNTFFRNDNYNNQTILVLNVNEYDVDLTKKQKRKKKMKMRDFMPIGQAGYSTNLGSPTSM